MTFGLELLIDLRPKTVDQHDFHAHALYEREILGNLRQFAGSDGFPCHRHHKGFATVRVDVRRH